MGIFDGFLDKMKLNDNYDEEDERDLYEDEEEEEVSSVRKPRSKSANIFEEDDAEEEETVRPVKSVSKPQKQSKPTRPSGNRVVSMPKNIQGLELCVIRPQNVEDGREISDTLLSGRPVVLNLEGIDQDLAQRIIDFTSGACYSIRGNLQKVTNYIFIVTPENVDISGDFHEQIGSDISFQKGQLY